MREPPQGLSSRFVQSEVSRTYRRQRLARRITCEVIYGSNDIVSDGKLDFLTCLGGGHSIISLAISGCWEYDSCGQNIDILSNQLMTIPLRKLTFYSICWTCLDYFKG